MLPLNCSAAGEALVGIFATMSLCVFLPESVGNVYSRGCWPTSGSIVPFVYALSGTGMHAHVHGRMDSNTGNSTIFVTHAKLHIESSQRAHTVLKVYDWS